MVSKTRGNNTKEKIAQLLDFFRKNKKNRYCMHEVASLFGISEKEASTNLSVLFKWGFLRIPVKNKCASLSKKHNAYQYNKGDGDAVRGRRFMSRSIAKRFVKKEQSKKVVVQKDQTEKLITIPVTVKVKVSLE